MITDGAASAKPSLLELCRVATEEGEANYDVDAVKRLFPVEGYEAVAIVPIGHIAPDCPHAEKKRKEMNEIFEEV